MPDYGFPLFDEAAAKLRDLGHEVINPAEVDRNSWPEHNFSSGKPPSDFNYKQVLLQDLRMISECDAIYTLPNWHQSPGATAEVAFAKAIGLKHIISMVNLHEAL